MRTGKALDVDHWALSLGFLSLSCFSQRQGRKGMLTCPCSNNAIRECFRCPRILGGAAVAAEKYEYSYSGYWMKKNV